VHACFIACDNPLKESFSFFAILHVSMCARLCPFVSCFGTHLTQILISEVLVDGATCRTVADVQFAGYICHSNPSVHLDSRASTRSTLSTVREVVGWPERSSLEPYQPLVLLPFCNTRVYPKDSGLAAWSENCKWYSYLPLGAVVSLFCESVWWVSPP
jgi:hypothetical protein